MKLKFNCPKPESQKNSNAIWRTSIEAFNDYAIRGLEAITKDNQSMILNLNVLYVIL